MSSNGGIKMETNHRVFQINTFGEMLQNVLYKAKRSLCYEII
jgi:hypothetical protein